QTLFFSATMRREVENLIQRFGKDPELVEIERKQMTVESIQQVSYEVRQRSKIEVISRLLDMGQPRLAMVFCNTKRTVDEVTEALLARGYAADRLHGDVTQMLRERVMRRFREGTVELLVATDVAARGVDVDEVDLVINHDLPQDPEDYVHRVGRTGRAGRSGKAVSLVFGRDIYRLQTIERFTRQRIPRGKIPTQEEVEGRWSDHLLDRIRERLEEGGYEDQSSSVERLLEQGHTSTDIAGAAVALLRESLGRESVEIDEDRPDRRRERGRKGRDRGPQDYDRSRGDRHREGQDRDEAMPRKSKRRAQGPPSGPGMTPLFISVGRNHGVEPKDIAGMLYRQAELPQGSVGRISLGPRHSMVEVKEQHVSQAIASARSTKLRGKTFIIDYFRE
ncbi:MAG: DEAD/DEAH box helicase, partial [Verrucomicrobiota bacterium]